jgi:hypothetical protein
VEVEGELLAADFGGETLNLRADVRAERAESSDDGERDERGGHGVFGQFQTSFIAEEFLNHVFAPSKRKFLSLLFQPPRA